MEKIARWRTVQARSYVHLYGIITSRRGAFERDAENMLRVRASRTSSA